MKILKSLFPKKREFILELDRPRTLKFNLAVVWALQRKLGVKDIQALYDIDTSEIPELVRAGLSWETPALSVADVRRMIQEKTGGDKFKLGQLMFLVHEAIIAGCGCGK
jgi:hypothetical protein